MIEQFVMAFVCVKVAQGARKVLESLNDTQKTAVLMADERVIIRTKLEKPSKIKGLALI